MEDSTFRFFAMFPLLLATFVNYLIPFLIKPAVLLVNLLTKFSVGFIYLGLQLAALINFVTFVFFGGFLSELSVASSSFLSSSSSSFLILRSCSRRSRSNSRRVSSDTPRGRVFFLDYTPLGQHQYPCSGKRLLLLIHCPVNDVGNNLLNQFFYFTGLDRR